MGESHVFKYMLAMFTKHKSRAFIITGWFDASQYLISD